ncbi:DUF6265 family protein [Flavobacterium sp.]|uniref:DUF6265 family protein n=1 Tax=Flavobacterium sp. TaxID=239 RepID=UPI00286C8161|nr:DUF6265 family protein [Flavobacterium sp.]
MKKIIAISVLILAFTSCNKSNKNDKIKLSNWLIGKWENKSESGNLEETWTKVNDSTFQGLSFYIKGKDTLHFESIVLQQNGEDLVYIPTVKGQNNDKPVPFKLTASTDKQLVFENPKHDYPQKIIYNQITNDSLVAEISGIQQGKPSSDKYPMKKVKQ